MKANKSTAFVSGIVSTLGAMFIENNGYNFIWSAVIFFPCLLIFAVGFEPWRVWATGERENIMWPNNSISWRILRTAWLRMFIFFLGACVAGAINAIYTKI